MDFKTQLEKNVRLKVSLSNGETFYEGKAPFEFIEGEKSALARLLEYIDTCGAEIRSVALLTRDGHEFNLPSAGNNPKFKVFAEAEKPFDYNAYRKIAGDMKLDGTPGKVDHFTVAEAFFETFSVQLWVNEDPPHFAYIVVKRP